MHRSMKESEPAHKTDSPKFESHLRAKEAEQEQAAAQVHAHERATVPQNGEDGNSQHTAVKQSVGHYVERAEKTKMKGLRRHRG